MTERSIPVVGLPTVAERARDSHRYYLLSTKRPSITQNVTSFFSFSGGSAYAAAESWYEVDTVAPFRAFMAALPKLWYFGRLRLARTVPNIKKIKPKERSDTVIAMLRGRIISLTEGTQMEQCETTATNRNVFAQRHSRYYVHTIFLCAAGRSKS
jgi:hypothetical protein